MTNYITPNANYDLFSTASYATLDTYLKNDAIVKFKTVLDTVTSMFSSEILKCFEQKSSNSNPRNVFVITKKIRSNQRSFISKMI